VGMWSQSLRFIFACYLLCLMPCFIIPKSSTIGRFEIFVGPETSIEQARAHGGWHRLQNHGSHWLVRTIEGHIQHYLTVHKCWFDRKGFGVTKRHISDFNLRQCPTQSPICLGRSITPILSALDSASLCGHCCPIQRCFH
jgi:hypothetical protein